MADINLKTLSPDTSLPKTGFLFGADSQATTDPSVYSTQTVATTLLGSTSLTGDVLTASAPVLDLAQTWNSVGTTFTGIKFNVDTTTYNQSAAASLLMDLQVGGATRFNVDKTGNISSPGYFVTNASQAWISSANNANARLNTSGLKLAANTLFGWTTTANESNAALDLLLTRKAAANLRFGAADAASATPQFLSVQSVVAGATNNPAGADFTITGSQGLGSGAGGSIVFQVAPAGSAGNPAQNALVNALTIDSSKNATFGNALIVQNGGANSGILFGNFDNGFYMPTSSSIYARNATNVVFEFSASYAQVTSVLSFGSAGSFGDTRLYRDAANTLAQRNGVNAQTFRLYLSYTDASNYTRFALKTATGVHTLETESAGTGEANIDLALTPKGTGRVRYGTHAAVVAEVVTGYIEVKDAGGTVRKLAVIS